MTKEKVDRDYEEMEKQYKKLRLAAEKLLNPETILSKK